MAPKPKPTVTDRLITILRQRGPLTALQLQDATGLSQTNIRRYLQPPTIVVDSVEWSQGGRGFVKRYRAALEVDLCDCGKQASYRWTMRQLSGDGKAKTEVLYLCSACVALLTPKERGECKPIR